VSRGQPHRVARNRSRRGVPVAHFAPPGGW
jgi:hypothetical protein